MSLKSAFDEYCRLGSGTTATMPTDAVTMINIVISKEAEQVFFCAYNN